jgi:tetratricopeptide (TPR) repeat protein
MLTEKSWKHYNLALQADSSLFSASNNAGVIALSYMNNPELALGYFKAALRVEPDIPQAHENMGDCYTKMGRKNEAIKEYETAITANPKLFRSYQCLIDFYEKDKQYNLEKAVLAKALANFPGSYFFTKKEGDVLKLENKNDKAAEKYEAAFAMNPNKELAGILAGVFEEFKNPEKAALYQDKYNNLTR